MFYAHGAQYLLTFLHPSYIHSNHKLYIIFAGVTQLQILKP
jgi:hypothetical protein